MKLIKNILKGMDLGDDPEKHTVAVAMSGGVDSSVTAALLNECGYKVIGLSMHLYEHRVEINNKKTCCAGVDISDARSVCNKLKIPHYKLNYSSKFNDKVMSDFTDAYIRGETPVPCIRCNQTVKFVDMLNYAKKLGASALATGHYIKRKMIKGVPNLYKAADSKKDQSYFLFATTIDQLEYLRFPLGDLEKNETRDLAKQYGLKVADKPDSQDICFVPEGRYSDLVRKLKPHAIDPGAIVHVDGTVLGKHKGIIDFTVGQRKGLEIGGRKGVSDEESILYVIKINDETNEVVVGPKKYLACDEIEVKDCNWLTNNEEKTLDVLVKLRNTFNPVPAKVEIDHENNTSKIFLDSPQYGISPGQAAVFYSKKDNAHVYGGGWIDKTPKYLNNNAKL